MVYGLVHPARFCGRPALGTGADEVARSIRNPIRIGCEDRQEVMSISPWLTIAHALPISEYRAGKRSRSDRGGDGHASNC